MDSARAIIRALKAGDRIAVIAFDDDASVIQPMKRGRSCQACTLRPKRIRWPSAVVRSKTRGASAFHALVLAVLSRRW